MIRKKIRKQVADELSRLHIPSHDNPAVACCIKAWKLSYCDAVLKGRSTAFAKERARVSFRLAMPPLAGEDYLHDFVACVTFGMLFGVISTAEGAKFLYAVQVTNSIVREAHRHQAQRSKKSNPSPHPRAACRTGGIPHRRHPGCHRSHNPDPHPPASSGNNKPHGPAKAASRSPSM